MKEENMGEGVWNDGYGVQEEGTCKNEKTPITKRPAT
jgi:hypothetical protein